MHLPRLTTGLIAATLLHLQLPTTILALKVACNSAWIEHTPFAYANRNVYKGSDAATLVSGGVASIGTVELGGNAETQGLKQYATHKNYRLIYVVVEATYRLVANKASGIKTLTDLKGKRIGTFASSSAEVFIHTLLGNAGLAQTDYTTTSGQFCMKAPCASNTMPAQLKSRQLDAFGCWETAVELGVQAAGEENVVVFKNASLYREIYSLYATEENLKNAATRKKIVQYVKALNDTLDIFRNEPEKVYSWVAQTIKADTDVVKKVWPDHKWGPGSLGTDLLDFLVREEKYLSVKDRRKEMSRKELARFIDSSVYEEALKL